MAFCRNCGTQISDTAAFCSQCGCPVNTASNNSPFIDNQYIPNAPIKNSLATASMVLGILGVIFWASPLIGFSLNITGLVLAVKSRNISINGKGTAGLVLTIIGLSLTVLTFIAKLSYRY